MFVESQSLLTRSGSSSGCAVRGGSRAAAQGSGTQRRSADPLALMSAGAVGSHLFSSVVFFCQSPNPGLPGCEDASRPVELLLAGCSLQLELVGPMSR